MTEQLVFGDTQSLTRKLVNRMDTLKQKLAELKADTAKLEDELKIAKKLYWQHKDKLRADKP